MPVTAATRKLKTAKRENRLKSPRDLTKSRAGQGTKNRPEVLPACNYTVSEAALAAGVSNPTIWRALDGKNLKCFRVGRRVIIGGQHLLDWLDSGGKTTRLRGGE